MEFNFCFFKYIYFIFKRFKSILVCKSRIKFSGLTFSVNPKTMRIIISWTVSDQEIHGMAKSKLPASSVVVPSVFVIEFSNGT